MTPDPVQRLLDLEEIRRLKHQYMRSIDTRDYVALRECLADDVTTAYADGTLRLHGADAVVDELRSWSRRHSTHVVAQPEIELVDESSARARWRLDELVVYDHDVIIRAASMYLDEYVKRSGRWLIHHTGYVRIFQVRGTVPDGFTVVDPLSHDIVSPDNPAWRPWAGLPARP